MRKKIIFLTMALMCLANFSKAEGVSIDDFTITQGETYEVTLRLDNTDNNLTSFSMAFVLPNGLSIASVEGTGRYAGQVTVGQPAGTNIYNVCGLDVELGTIVGTSGDLIKITFEASNSFKGGDALITEIDFITTDRRHVTYDDVEFVVDYEKGQASRLGDVNDDGNINVNDVMWVVSYILGDIMPGFNELNADVNFDGNINVIDAMIIVDIILSQD